MKDIKILLEKNIHEESIIQIILSNMRVKGEDEYSKITIRPFLIKDELKYQIEYHFTKKVTHENILPNELETFVMNIVNDNAKQVQIFTKEANYQVLISKKLKVKIITNKPTKKYELKSHNESKNYIIPNNEKCDFLIRLGVMDKHGRVHDKSYSKFRQINRYLEIVKDSIAGLKINKEFNIVDFGCGKAYLTFAVYWYLVEKLGYNVNIVGLDLKTDVVDYCNKVAIELGFDKLVFIEGDIADYDTEMKINMVITLHACDTATDEALIKSVGWGAEIILSVPCCQHELFSQLKNITMDPMIKYGIQKDRVTAMVTDSLRAMALEVNGYGIQMIEFIDMEHTSKNLMIKAIKQEKANEDALKQYNEFKKFWNVKPTIDKLIG